MTLKQARNQIMPWPCPTRKVVENTDTFKQRPSNLKADYKRVSGYVTLLITCTQHIFARSLIIPTIEVTFLLLR